MPAPSPILDRTAGTAALPRAAPALLTASAEFHARVLSNIRFVADLPNATPDRKLNLLASLVEDPQRCKKREDTEEYALSGAQKREIAQAACAAALEIAAATPCTTLIADSLVRFTAMIAPLPDGTTVRPARNAIRELPLTFTQNLEAFLIAKHDAFGKEALISLAESVWGCAAPPGGPERLQQISLCGTIGSLLVVPSMRLTAAEQLRLRRSMYSDQTRDTPGDQADGAVFLRALTGNPFISELVPLSVSALSCGTLLSAAKTMRILGVRRSPLADPISKRLREELPKIASLRKLAALAGEVGQIGSCDSDFIGEVTDKLRGLPHAEGDTADRLAPLLLAASNQVRCWEHAGNEKAAKIGHSLLGELLEHPVLQAQPAADLAPATAIAELTALNSARLEDWPWIDELVPAAHRQLETEPQFVSAQERVDMLGAMALHNCYRSRTVELLCAFEEPPTLRQRAGRFCALAAFNMVDTNTAARDAQEVLPCAAKLPNRIRMRLAMAAAVFGLSPSADGYQEGRLKLAWRLWREVALESRAAEALVDVSARANYYHAGFALGHRQAWRFEDVERTPIPGSSHAAPQGTSPFEADVTGQLKQMGFNPTVQAYCGGYWLDLAIPNSRPAGRIAYLEVNGHHSHSVIDLDGIEEPRLNGATVVKNGFFSRRRNCRLIPIPAGEYPANHCAPDREKQAFLRVRVGSPEDYR